jgi:hypothetical protein
VFSFIKMRESSTYSSMAIILNLYGQSSNYIRLCITSCSVSDVFRKGLRVLITGLECLLGWERLPSFGLYGYVGMIKCSIIKLFKFVGYLMVHQNLPFMVVSMEGGESNLVMEVCLWLEATSNEGYF